VEGRVDEARSLAPGPFDPVYITQGPICWLPDLKIWANAIATVLAPGGEHYFADAHPSFMLMEERGDKLEPTYDFQTPAERPLEFTK
jgi:SAM-dependent methyltransferase